MTARAASPPPEQPPLLSSSSSPAVDGSAPAPTVSPSQPLLQHSTPPPEQQPQPTLHERNEESVTTTDTSNNNNKTANHVYIWHPDHAWIPAQVIERPSPDQTIVNIPLYGTNGGEQAIVCDGGRTARQWDKQTISLSRLLSLNSNNKNSNKHTTSCSYPNQALPLQNVDPEGRLQVVEDMVDLPFLHEVRFGCVCGYFVCVGVVLCGSSSISFSPGVYSCFLLLLLLLLG